MQCRNVKQFTSSAYDSKDGQTLGNPEEESQTDTDTPKEKSESDENNTEEEDDDNERKESHPKQQGGKRKTRR